MLLTRVGAAVVSITGLICPKKKSQKINKISLSKTEKKMFVLKRTKNFAQVRTYFKMKNEVFEREITKPPVSKMIWRTESHTIKLLPRHTSFNSVKIINAYYFALQVDLATHSSSTKFFPLVGL